MAEKVGVGVRRQTPETLYKSGIMHVSGAFVEFDQRINKSRDQRVRDHMCNHDSTSTHTKESKAKVTL